MHSQPTPRTLRTLRTLRPTTGGRLALIASLILAGSLLAPALAADVTGTIAAPVPKHRANTVVFVRNAGLEPAPKTAHIDQVGLVFVPRVVAIQKGSTVEFKNSDPVAHNVNTPDGVPYDLGTWPKGESRSHTFPQAGAFRQLCRVHDDMMAWVVAVDSRYFAVSDKTGAFTLKDLPPGKYTLGVWHEKLVGDDVTIEVGAAGAPPVTLTLKPKG